MAISRQVRLLPRNGKEFGFAKAKELGFKL